MAENGLDPLGRGANGRPDLLDAGSHGAPYVIQGSDYYQGQRVVAGPLTLLVTSYGRQAGPTTAQTYHLVTLRIENTSPDPLPILFDLSLLRTLKTPDGRTVQGEWMHSTEAAAALGYPPSDPLLTRAADGTMRGGYPPGTTTRTLVFMAPAGEAQSWGTQLTDAPGSQLWVLLRPNPHCTKAGGGPIDGSAIAGWHAARGRGRLAGPPGYPDQPRIRMRVVLYRRARPGLPGGSAVVARRHRLGRAGWDAAVCGGGASDPVCRR